MDEPQEPKRPRGRPRQNPDRPAISGAGRVARHRARAATQVGNLAMSWCVFLSELEYRDPRMACIMRDSYPGVFNFVVHTLGAKVAQDLIADSSYSRVVDADKAERAARDAGDDVAHGLGSGDLGPVRNDFSATNENSEPVPLLAF